MSVIPNENEIVELFVGPLLSFLIILIIVILIILVIKLIGRIKLFIKCGQDWWKAIIPIYGTYIQDVKICNLHWVFFILEEAWPFGLYGSVLSIIVKIMSFYNLAKKCNKDPIVTIIFGTIFSGIVIMIYGLSSAVVYDKKIPVSKCGIFGNIIK